MGYCARRYNAPGHNGYAKAYGELNGMETLEWPTVSPILVGRCRDGVGRGVGTGSAY